MKRVTLILLLLPAVVLLAGLAGLAAVDDASLVSWLLRRIETATGTQISYQQPPDLTRGLTPTLNLKSLKIVDTQQTFRMETHSFTLQVSLPALLIGRLDVLQLALDDTRVQLQDRSRGSRGLHIDPARLWFKPVFHQVQLTGLSVSAEGESWRLPLGEVTRLGLQLKSDGTTPELYADLVLEGNRLHIDAVLPGFYRAARQQPLPFVVRVTGDQIDGELKGRGRPGREQAADWRRAADARHGSVQLARGRRGIPRAG